MTLVASNSTRISKRFGELRASGELGIVAYIVAGDPSLDASLKYVLALAEAGADVIELGVPFSDPLADGPTIQRSAERALKAGVTLARVLDLVRRIRLSSQIPLVLFSYYNPILQMGLEKFASAAASAGADGVLVTDLTPEESEDYRRILAAQHLDTIFLGAPTSTDDRCVGKAAENGNMARKRDAEADSDGKLRDAAGPPQKCREIVGQGILRAGDAGSGNEIEKTGGASGDFREAVVSRSGCAEEDGIEMMSGENASIVFGFFGCEIRDEDAVCTSACSG